MSPACIPQRVVALIPSLGRSNDYEVVATARAIERVLQGAGTDWHGLAAAVVTARPASRPVKAAAREPGRPKPSAPPPQRPTWDEYTTSARRAWAGAVLARVGFNGPEKRLARRIYEELHAGLIVEMTPQQKAALTRLLKKSAAMGIRLEGAPA